MKHSSLFTLHSSLFMALAGLLASHSHAVAAITATKEYVDRQDAAITNAVHDIQRDIENKADKSKLAFILAGFDLVSEDGVTLYRQSSDDENLWIGPGLPRFRARVSFSPDDTRTWRYSTILLGTDIWACEPWGAERLNFYEAMAGGDGSDAEYSFSLLRTNEVWIAVTNTVVYSDALADGLTLGSGGDTTGYKYDGVTVTRGGESADFLFGTTNQYGVVRFRDLEPIITSICLSLIGNIYWQSDDGGRTMDAYYRDPETISNIVSTAVAYIAETRASAFLRIEDGAAVVYQPDAEEMGGVADRNAPTNTLQGITP